MEVIMARFVVLSIYLLGLSRTMKTHRMVSIPAEIQAMHFPDTSHTSQLAHSVAG
jgi:hypothetical protein